MCINERMKNSYTREENGMKKRNLLLLSVTTIIMLLTNQLSPIDRTGANPHKGLGIEVKQTPALCGF